MKYLTNEWYWTDRRSQFGEGYLQATKEASEKNEALYQKLYNDAKKEFAKSVCGYDEEEQDAMLAKVDRILNDPATDAQKRNQMESFLETYKALRAEDEVDDEAVNAAFEGWFAELMKTVDSFPQAILAKVADKRVFALGYATEEVAAEATAYAAEEAKKAEAAMTNAMNAIDEAEKNMKKPAGLKENPNGCLEEIEETKDGVRLVFEDIPDIFVKGGKVTQKAYPVHPYLLDDNAFAPMTMMLGKELDYADGKYVLRLLLEDVQSNEVKTAWELIVEGNDVQWEE